MIDLRTDNEKETSKRKDIINALFDQIDKESGNHYSTWRICVHLSKQLGMTAYNVYNYCKRMGKRSYADRHAFDNFKTKKDE